MSSNPPSHVAHCPHCLCALDTRQRYSVQVCLPIHPSYAFQVPTNAIARSSPSSVPHDHVNTPAPPYEPPSYSRHTGGQDRATQGGCHHPPTRSSSSYPQLAGGGQDHAAHSQSNHVSTPSPSNNPRPAGDRRERNPLSTPSSNDLQPVGGRRDDVTRGESRRSSSSSPSTVYSEFTDYTINTDIAAGLQAAEDMLLPQLHSELNSSPRPRPPASSPPPGSSPPPRSSPPRSSPPLMSSPPAESLTLPTSSPPPQSQLTLPLSGRQPPTLKRAQATSQTNGFPNAFMLVFDNPAAALAAYRQFQQDGTIPSHGRGPWVVFVGRRPGVFTTFQEVHNSVVGYRNNSYRCCASVEEGNRALREFLAQQSNTILPAPATQTVPKSTHPKRLDVAVSPADSWWFCFAGAEPGIYKGVANLTKASPAPGGACRVDTEEEARAMWDEYFNQGKIDIVLHPK